MRACILIQCETPITLGNIKGSLAIITLVSDMSLTEEFLIGVARDCHLNSCQSLRLVEKIIIHYLSTCTALDSQNNNTVVREDECSCHTTHNCTETIHALRSTHIPVSVLWEH